MNWVDMRQNLRMNQMLLPGGLCMSDLESVLDKVLVNSGERKFLSSFTDRLCMTNVDEFAQS